MGTSKAFGGPSAANPLLPSWLQPPPELPPSELPPVAQLPPAVQLPTASLPPAGQPPEAPLPPAAPPDGIEIPSPARYQTPRRLIKAIARGGSSNAAGLRSATSSYVRKGLGGAKRAGARMAVSAKTAGRVVSFIRAVEQHGFVQAAKDFGLGDLIGKTPHEIGPVLAEAFLENGGTIDEGISNRAWTDTVLEAIEAGLPDVNAITGETMIVMLENYVTRTIELRLQQDIGSNILPFSPTVARAQQLKMEIRQLVRGEVRRAVRPVLQAAARVDRSKLSSVGLRIYRQTFEYLQALSAED